MIRVLDDVDQLAQDIAMDGARFPAYPIFR
jgi:hypothetical protein